MSSSIYRNSARDSNIHTNRGMGNLGNTCFASSVIQLLSNIPSFNRPFLSGSIEREYIEGENSDVTKSLSKCIHSLHNKINCQEQLQQDYSIFKKAFESQHEQYEGTDQHDAQECLGHVLDCIKHDVNRASTKSKVDVEWGQGENETPDDAVKRIKSEVRQNEDSIVNDLFTSLEQSTICCHECGHKSIRYTNQDTLSLQIPYPEDAAINEGIITGEKTTIKQLVTNYFNSEEVKYNCPRCTNNKMTKTLRIVQSPEIMITHLKRFKHSNIANERAKVNSKVEMGIHQNLDISPYIAKGIMETAEYKIMGFITHHGRYGSGHYTASIHDATNNEWRVYNDGEVDVIPDSVDVVNGDTYIALWQKTSVVTHDTNYERCPYEALSNVELDYESDNESDGGTSNVTNFNTDDGLSGMPLVNDLPLLMTIVKSMLPPTNESESDLKLKPSTTKEDSDDSDDDVSECYSIPPMAYSVASDTESEYKLSDTDSDSDGM